MCISSKSQTVFWEQNFRDVQLIPNRIDGFSYGNNILTKFL